MAHFIAAVYSLTKEKPMPYPRFENLEEDKRQQIMHAALQEFSRNNFNQASLNKITKSAGLSAGALYYYFENKEDLFSTCMQHVFRKFTNRVGAIQERLSETGDFWNEMEQMAIARLELSLEEPEIGAMLNKLLEIQDSEESVKIEKYFKNQALRVLHHVFKIGLAQGNIRKDLPEDLLLSVHIHLVLVMNQWIAQNSEYLSHYPPKPEKINEFKQKAIEMIRSVLQPPA